jgi:hypothetical protein
VGSAVRIEIAALGAAIVTIVGPRLARADAPVPWWGAPSGREATVELVPDIGVAWRPAATGHGVRYGVGLTYGGHIQIPLLRVLRLTTYYEHLRQSIEVDRGALGGGAEVTPLDDLDSYVIGARLQPVYHVSDRLRFWANVGVAWGIMTAPKVRVSAPISVDVGMHGDAFVEFPFGAGGEFEFWPGTLGITADAAAGPALSGFDITVPRQAIDASGRLVSVPTLPPFGSTWTATIGLAIHL